MSTVDLAPYPPVVVRAADAERVESIGHTLLADSPATAGALSTHRVTLGAGADGAVPHRHDRSSELFFVLDGALQLLLGDEIVVGRAGDLVVVPPAMAHAFAAPAGEPVDALVVITPGTERFDYFRHVARQRAGLRSPDVLRGMQDRFDTHFVESATWHDARSSS